MVYEQKCVICGGNAEISPSQSFGFVNECLKCGKIIFTLDAEHYLKGLNGLKLQACLFHYFRHLKGHGIYLISKDKIDKPEVENITLSEIMSIFPRNLSERIDMVLLNFASLGNYLGAEIIIAREKEKYSHLFVAENLDFAPAEKRMILDIMETQKLIKMNGIPANGSTNLSLDYSGWQRIDELNKINSLHGQGFIAMMFSDSTKEIQQAIEQAISDAGYIPQIMNKHQHNGQVIPEMLYQIRMSDFLVADLTGNRGGVYFEAGYALGMKKEVIFTVNEDMVKKDEEQPMEDRRNIPHFDVAQYNQIRYTSAEDLKQKLKDRIIATVGDRRNK